MFGAEIAEQKRNVLASLTTVMLAGGAFLTSPPSEASILEAVYGNNKAKPDKAPKFMLGCNVTTIAGLRNEPDPSTETVYFVSDHGQEGWFYYDPTDRTTADNSGTVIVSVNGFRFLRVVQGELNVKWFGAAGWVAK